jgi:aminopeptidase N
MAIEFIGMDAFREGIRSYLNHFKFRNATTVDLWKFLGAASGKDLPKLLELWTGAQGYPVLEVSRSGSVLTIEQRRFLSSGDVRPEDDQVVWQIPLLIRIEGCEGDTRTVLTERVNKVEIPAGARWVKVNSRQAAFCRVKYAPELLRSLAESISAASIEAVDRLGIAGDYLAFAQCGLCSTVEALQLAEAYIHETDYSVWCAIVNLETEVRTLAHAKGDDVVARYDAYCHRLYGPAMARLGFSPSSTDDHRSAQLRGALFSRMTVARSDAAIAAAKAMFTDREGKSISADLRDAVYATAVREGFPGAFEAMLHVAETSDDAMERTRALRALGAVRDAVAVHAVLEFAMSDKVRSQDLPFLFGSVCRSPHGSGVYPDFFMSQWSLLWTRLPGLMLGETIKEIGVLCDAKVADRVEAWWSSVDEKQRMAMDRSMRQGVEGIRSNARWAARDGEAVASFLE